jgi:hypothetical protein
MKIVILMATTAARKEINWREKESKVRTRWVARSEERKRNQQRRKESLFSHCRSSFAKMSRHWTLRSNRLHLKVKRKVERRRRKRHRLKVN